MGGLPVERACSIDVKSHNGVPALYIAFFFKQDRLQFVSVNIPRWSLRDAKENLNRQFGSSVAIQLIRHNGVRLEGWHLSNGSGLFLNRDQSDDFFSWNSILWVNTSICKDNGCFKSGGSGSFLERLMSL